MFTCDLEAPISQTEPISKSHSFSAESNFSIHAKHQNWRNSSHLQDKRVD